MPPSNHCQHCGEEVPYHGLWKEPDIDAMYEYYRDHGGKILVKTNNDVHGAYIYVDRDKACFNYNSGHHLEFNDITEWMPAPE